MSSVVELSSYLEKYCAASLYASTKVKWLATPAETIASIMGDKDSAAVLDRATRIDAPDFALPDLSKSPEQAARELASARERLETVVIDADGQDMSLVRQSHHVFGELDFYQWVAFAGFHERRHTAQLRELAALLGDFS